MFKGRFTVPELFGKQLTRRLVKTDVASVIRHAEAYCNILKMKYLLSCLSFQQIQDFHFAILPKDFDKFNDSLCYSYGSKIDHFSILKSLSANQRERVLIENFHKAYGKEVSECLGGLPLGIIPLLGGDLRKRWAEDKLKETGPEDEVTLRLYTSYLPWEESFPKLKRKLSKEGNSYGRLSLIELMFDSLKLNGKVDEIGELAEYIVTRLRNDTSDIRGTALRDLVEKVDLLKLKLDKWPPIMELINISVINDEIGSHGSRIVSILQIYIQIRLAQKLSVEDQFKVLLKYIPSHYKFEVAKNTPYEKQFLVWFGENLWTKSYKDDCHQKSSYVRLFCAIKTWNSNNQNDQIKVPDWLMKQMYNIALKEDYAFLRTDILSALKKDAKTRLEILGKLFETSPTVEHMFYKLHRTPESLLNDLDKVFEKVLSYHIKKYNRCFKCFKLLLVFQQKIIDLCLKVLNSEDSDLSSKSATIYVLSMLMDAPDYIKIIKPYYPEKHEIDDYGDSNYVKVHLQSAIASDLKYTSHPYEMLEPIRAFAVGDYLKHVVPTIPLIFYKIDERRALETLKSWIECPVSLRKHLIRAYSRVATINDSLELLLSVINTEKNFSLREIIVNMVCSHFKNEPQPETWSGLKSILFKLNITDRTENNDNKLFYALLNLNNVPDRYICDFIETLWNVAKGSELEGDHKERCLEGIIRLINPTTLPLMSEEFCDVLISLMYRSGSCSLQEVLNRFATFYLVYSGSEKEQKVRLGKITRVMDDYLFKSWWEDKMEESLFYPSHQLLHRFVELLCEETRATPLRVEPKYLLSQLKDHFLLSFKDPTSIFFDLILLDLSLIYHGLDQTLNDEQIFRQYIKSSCALMEEKLSEFNTEYSFYKFYRLIDESRSWLSLEEKYQKPLIVDTIMTNFQSKTIIPLVFRFLPEDKSALLQSEIFKSCLMKLKTLNDPSVNLVLNDYIALLK
jgi:hypothetical protein